MFGEYCLGTTVWGLLFEDHFLRTTVWEILFDNHCLRITVRGPLFWDYCLGTSVCGLQFGNHGLGITVWGPRFEDYCWGPLCGDLLHEEIRCIYILHDDSSTLIALLSVHKVKICVSVLKRTARPSPTFLLICASHFFSRHLSRVQDM